MVRRLGCRSRSRCRNRTRPLIAGGLQLLRPRRSGRARSCSASPLPESLPPRHRSRDGNRAIRRGAPRREGRPRRSPPEIGRASMARRASPRLGRRHGANGKARCPTGHPETSHSWSRPRTHDGSCRHLGNSAWLRTPLHNGGGPLVERRRGWSIGAQDRGSCWLACRKGRERRRRLGARRPVLGRRGRQRCRRRLEQRRGKGRRG